MERAIILKSKIPEMAACRGGVGHGGAALQGAC